MVDTWTKTKRSQVMASIRSKGNLSTEMRLITLFRKFKITGWRRHPKLPGKPDFHFPKHKLVIFVDGDFWHGNPSTYRQPKSNMDFWQRKIQYNRKHDREVTRLLRTKGLVVVRIWESALQKKPINVLSGLRKLLPKSRLGERGPGRKGVHRRGKIFVREPKESQT